MRALVSKPSGTPFDGVLLAQDYFRLPTDTPYGNLTSKLMKVGERIGHANHRLSECYAYWDLFRSGTLLGGPIDPSTLHSFTGEEAVSMLRRAADELVGLIWVLTRRQEDGTYPQKVRVDSIAGALDLDWPIFENHCWLLETLNSVSNAHKHSFLQSDLNVVGALEPCVASLAVTRNNLAETPAFRNVALGDLVNAFSRFLGDAFERLRELAQDLGAPGGT